MTLFAELRDTVSPSIAESWYLEVVFPDGRKTQAIPMMIHQNGPVPLGMDGGAKAFYDPKDSLIHKVASTPLPVGGMATGYVMFKLAHSFSRKEVEVSGTKYILHCKDVDGNDVQAESVSDGTFNGRLPMSPGMTEPTVGVNP